MLPYFLWWLQVNIKVNFSLTSAYSAIIFVAFLLQFLQTMDSVLRVTGRRIPQKQLCSRVV